MRNKFYQITIGCCAVFFCAASCYAQFYVSIPYLCESYVVCSPVYPTSIKPKDSKITGMNTSLVLDSCRLLKQWMYTRPQDGDYQTAKEQYDTLRLFIEKCAATDSESWRVFSSLDGAVQLMSDDTTRFDNYRAWLISVLYFNKTNPEYFCVCMGSIAGTYQYGKYNPLGYLAVLNYVRHFQPQCWNASGDQEYSQDSLYDAQHRYDPTHLPSLDSMGLGFLLTQSGVTPTTTAMTNLASFTSSPNPFTSGTKLNFALNRMTYVTIEVYDLLGNKVFASAGRSYEAGSYEINLDGSALPSGTLYARISMGFGEVKTVKLVHEK
jgi:hypothetical protein